MLVGVDDCFFRHVFVSDILHQQYTNRRERQENSA